MRHVPASLEAKLRSARQTSANNSAPALDLWISRPVVPLVNDYFLEQQAVQDGSNVTAVDIAVCHPRHRRQSTKIYMARVESGTAKVLSSPFRHAMEAHVWTDCGFSEPAEDVALAFDAVMKNDTRGRSEFVTEELPWVFWVSGGALYGRKLGSEDTLTLAEANCTKCTAIRAAGSAMGGFDYGLCLFFLLGGAIYVRQLIGGEWMDAEPIGFGPDVVWTDIAASRSWDYRIILQAMASDSTVYELFTQYMGIGQRSAEHISLKADADGDLLKVNYRDTAQKEHLDLYAQASGSLIYGLSSIPIGANNISDGADKENWGIYVVVSFDYPVRGTEENISAFTLVDGNGITYVCTSAVTSSDGLSITLGFVDFNNAYGTDVSVKYDGGTIQCPAALLDDFSYTFTPQNLVPTATPAPEVSGIWNE